MAARARVDFSLRSDDYAKHRPGFPASFYDRLERIFPIHGTRALDLGTGPGVVALELARRGAQVIGLDIAAGQIETARRCAQKAALDDRAHFEVRRAEETGLADGFVDLVIAGQCWVWVDQERTLAEAARVLVPGGYLVVAHYCYLPHRSRLAALSEELVLKHNPVWKMGGWNGIYHTHIDALQTDDLTLVEQFCYDHVQPFSHEAWRGRMRTCNGVGSGGMSTEAVERFDADLAQLLTREFPDEPVLVEHRVWAVVCRRHARPIRNGGQR